MAAATLRAVIATERLDKLNLLKEIVEGESRVTVVGRAQNALKAMDMARSLRPEVVIVDSCLPYAVGLDSVRLSRIGGWDAAAEISQELPRSRVVIVPNMNVKTYQEKDSNGGTAEHGYMLAAHTGIPLRLWDVLYETPSTGLVYANVERKEQVSSQYLVLEVIEKAMLYSFLALMGGIVLMISLVFMGAGAVLSVLAIVVLLLSLASRAIATFWFKRNHNN